MKNKNTLEELYELNNGSVQSVNFNTDEITTVNLGEWKFYDIEESKFFSENEFYVVHNGVTYSILELNFSDYEAHGICNGDWMEFDIGAVRFSKK